MAPYARTEVTVIALVGALLTLGVAWWAGWWALLPTLFTLALLAFYRDPRRVPVAAPRSILAPADGRIVRIDPPTGEGPLRIMIFLSVFNVHINRSPCAGTVTAVEYRAGAFLNALRPEADERNECNTLTLAPAAPLPGPIQVRQIAGVLARRIVCAARPGTVLSAGARYGMIKLGSRTEITLPRAAAWEVCVQPGQRVRAGLTVLARLRGTEHA
ncbi:MAG: phosphatidylserine decarboxylase family protein [Phycisphaerales bacterium]|nr:phosphatidylserine decarboxylase family protein [Phycisphaerales bacterium]